MDGFKGHFLNIVNFASLRFQFSNSCISAIYCYILTKCKKIDPKDRHNIWHCEFQYIIMDFFSYYLSYFFLIHVKAPGNCIAHPGAIYWTKFVLCQMSHCDPNSVSNAVVFY